MRSNVLEIDGSRIAVGAHERRVVVGGCGQVRSGDDGAQSGRTLSLMTQLTETAAARIVRHAALVAILVCVGRLVVAAAAAAVATVDFLL